MPITGQKTTVPYVSTPNVVIDNLQNKNILSWDSNQKAFVNSSINLSIAIDSQGNGDQQIVKEATDEHIVLRDLVGGANISLSLDSNGNIVISQDITSIPLVDGENLGTGTGIFNGKVNTKLTFNTIDAGNNITLSEQDNVITIATTSPDDGLNTGTGAGTFKDKFNNNLRFRSLVAGKNISITQNADDIEITTDIGTGTDQEITTRFEFRANFDANGNVSSITNLPAGWSYTVQNNVVSVNHTTGRTLAYVTYFGYDSTTTSYRMRVPTSAYYISYQQGTETSSFDMLINAASAGTFSNGHAIIKLVF
jgi:hypothetical protein